MINSDKQVMFYYMTKRLKLMLEHNRETPIKIFVSYYSFLPVNLFDDVSDVIYLWFPKKKLLVLKNKKYKRFHEKYIAEEVEKLGIEIRCDFES